MRRERLARDRYYAGVTETPFTPAVAALDARTISAIRDRTNARLSAPVTAEDIRVRKEAVTTEALRWRNVVVSSANLPAIYRPATFEKNEKGELWDKSGDNAYAWEFIRKIAYDFQPGMHGAILFGVAGSGKTSMACVTAKRLVHKAADRRNRYGHDMIDWREARKRGEDVPEPVKPFMPTIGLINWSEWANQMAEAMTQRRYLGEPRVSRDALLAQVTRPTLLVVDDIGKNEGLKEDQARAYMFMLVNERYTNRVAKGYVTIYTTNLSYETLADRYNDPGDKAIDEGADAYGDGGKRLNGATTSRLLHDCDYISVGMVDRRLMGRDK
jgi:DNA replication protein DnaC